MLANGTVLVAGGATPAGADPAAEDVAVGAALLTEEAGATGRALVDAGAGRGVPRRAA